jgi:hypothetical protein
MERTDARKRRRSSSGSTVRCRWLVTVSLSCLAGCSRRPDIENVCTLGLVGVFGAVPAEETQACADANGLVLDGLPALDRQSMEHCFSCLSRERVVAPLCAVSCSGTVCASHGGVICGECDPETLDEFCELGGQPAVAGS